MYYKIINDRTVISDCKVIQLNGHDISNPTAEMIAQAGWTQYVPPPYVPTPQTEPAIAEVMQAVKRMLSTETSELSDEDALDVAAMFPTWISLLPEDPLNPKPSDTLPIGERVWYDGKLWKVTQAHVPQSNWTPDTAVSLFTEVSIVEWPEIPENIPSTAPWMAGDKGTWQGQHYICQINNTVHNPSQYPAAWQLQP